MYVQYKILQFIELSLSKDKYLNSMQMLTKYFIK